MPIATQRFIRKPVYVDAVRITAANFDEMVDWCQGEVHEEPKGNGLYKKYIKVRVQNPKNPRQSKAYIGDWLLYTETGYKVYTNKAFRTAFDVVEEPKTPAQAAEDARAKEAEMLEPQEESSEPPTTAHENAIKDAQLQSIDIVAADPEADNGVNPIVQTYQGKRVLSVQEQETMTADEVRTLIQAGEVVLIQDVPNTTQ